MGKLACLFLVFPLASGLAQQPKLPIPLKLPPGLEEILPISKAGSYLADATKHLDCPEEKFQATAGGDRAVAVKSGEIKELSSYGDQVSLRHTIPCDIADKNFTFEYTNSANGISTAPDSRFFIVQIDGGLVSNADSALPLETEP